MQRRKNTAANHVAKKVVQYARKLTYPNNKMLECIHCGLFPIQPITGICGHTRCSKCIKISESCACGIVSPPDRQVNILVHQLLEKMVPPELKQCMISAPSTMPTTSLGRPRLLRPLPMALGPLRHKTRNQESPYPAPVSNPRRRCFNDPEVQYVYAQRLIHSGRHREAASHLAHVAASGTPVARKAQDLLSQSIQELVKSINRSRLTRELYRDVRANSATAWLELSDLECIICCQLFHKPVTTPCGHTFCKECILRAIGENKHCAVCRHPLDFLTLVLTANTHFVEAALLALAPKPPPPLEFDGSLIPIFDCTVAFPTVPCPILILGPHRRTMIRRILDSGNRRIGMVTSFSDGSLALTGTIVEVRDCVQMEDGLTILSTVGISRFHTLARYSDESCNIALVVELTDLIPVSDPVTCRKLVRLARIITIKAMMWLRSLAPSVVADIEEAFGPMPFCGNEELWWENPHCPKWLWWLVAILPLRPEVQVLMISTSSLIKRMMAVSRTLDVVGDLTADLYRY